MNGKKYAIIGGDLRSIKLAEALKADGNSTTVFGFRKAGFDIPVAESGDLALAISQADIVVGPIPCSNDGETVNAPFHEGRLYINEVFQKMAGSQLFLAGRMGEKTVNLARIYNVRFFDILGREEMAVCNAIPTAEGAIQIAMEEMPTTLHGCSALVLGYGRIGKVLSKMLAGIGANVSAGARKYSDIAWIKAYGYRPVMIPELKNALSSFDVVFNTIPSIVLDGEALKVIQPECLIIDLASKPGGVDFNKARELGRKTIWALSLPGKVAPLTAAVYIKDTIYNIVSELEV